MRRAFFEKVMQALGRLRTDNLSPVGEVIFVHRTRGTVDDLESLREIPSERLEAWRDAVCVDPVAWVWNRAQLSLIFDFCVSAVRTGTCLVATSVVCGPDMVVLSLTNFWGRLG